jgi:dinuclear metal center YbgI/SA1388 family protein
MGGSITVGEIVAGLLERFPRTWAESWDRVGLVAGDPATEARSVFVTLDLDREAYDAARSAGVDLVVTHHPPFLESVGDLTRPVGAAAHAWDAVREGMAVASFHTNLDRSPAGASALPLALGLEPGEPLEHGEVVVDLVTAYVPAEALDEVVSAMGRAGAGRIGEYERCAFESEGVGHYIPLTGSSPATGTPGSPSREPERRVEMVCDPALTGAVITAARAVHPYEEPVLLVATQRLDRGVARLGRVSPATGVHTTADLAARVADRLGVTPRVWGRTDAEIATVGIAGGSASSLVGTALAADVDALVVGEVRYHVAQEAVESGMIIVEGGHDATEWPLVQVLAEAVRAVIGVRRARVVEDEAHTHWWTWGVE